METKKRTSTSYGGVDHKDDDEGHSSIKKRTTQEAGDDERRHSIDAVGLAGDHLRN